LCNRPNRRDGQGSVGSNSLWACCSRKQGSRMSRCWEFSQHSLPEPCIPSDMFDSRHGLLRVCAKERGSQTRGGGWGGFRLELE
jgi:hypothetical protein